MPATAALLSLSTQDMSSPMMERNHATVCSPTALKQHQHPGPLSIPSTPACLPRSCPSDAEENACLYNMACCYCKLGQVDAAFTCIEAVLENGGCSCTLQTSLRVTISKAVCTWCN
jgi:pentatricopeptide repeat protein